MKTLILTPNKNEMCGMYQLAKDLAKEFDGDIRTRDNFLPLSDYDEVITFLYPMHKLGKKAKKMGKRWICYDQGIPPVTKRYFPNFFRRMYMHWFNWANKKSMQGADEYWDVTKREQKPRWVRLSKIKYHKPYSLFLGRRTDYKNYNWLSKVMRELRIDLNSSYYWEDKDTHTWLSNAKMLVTASTWEGYGRPVMEACALGIPVVCFDTGAHLHNMLKYKNKGKCVPNHRFDLLKKAIKEVWEKNKK